MPIIDAIIGPTAQIVVGPPDSAKSFSIHKKLLCDSSTYFQAALNNGFAETTEQKIIMDDEDPSLFRTFVLWLYRGKLESKDFALATLDASTAEQYLLSLYVLADKRGISDLGDDIITMLASIWANTDMAFAEIVWVLPAISRGSMLYDLIVDNIVLCLRSDSLSREHLDQLRLSRDVLVDLSVKSNELSDDFQDESACYESICHYHLHEGPDGNNDEECCQRLEDGRNMFDKDFEFPAQVQWSFER